MRISDWSSDVCSADLQPGQVQLAFNLIGARCMTGGIQATDLAAARTAMQGTPNTGTLFASWFDRTLPVALSGECPGLTTRELQELIDTSLKNPKISATGPQQDMNYQIGRAHV